MNKFSDLQTRLVSGVIMAIVGLGAIWLGGWPMNALALVLAALMGWELHKMMMQPDVPEGRAEATGLVAALLVGVFTFWQAGYVALAGLLLGAAVMAWRMPRDRLAFGLYFALILLATHGLILLRDAFGLALVFWLVLIVVASDLAGYFVGRVVGGPKFWPRFSPKKTWSGTIGGWVLAAVVGAVFVATQGWPASLIALSVLLAFAGQLGDIAESALKRRAGVKDSSALIPGHGGVLDRFDALAAVLALTLLMAYAGAFAGLAD